MTDQPQAFPTSDDATHDQHVAKLVDLTKGSRFAMLTTVDEAGQLVSRPMTRQEVDLDADLWFIATRDSRKVAHINADPVVGLTFASSDSWVSLSGRAEVVDDNAKLAELWNSFAEAWLPEGPEDPNAILLHVDVDTAQYWDSPGGRIASLVSFAKAKITGDPYDGGDSEVVTGL